MPAWQPALRSPPSRDRGPSHPLPACCQRSSGTWMNRIRGSGRDHLLFDLRSLHVSSRPVVLAEWPGARLKSLGGYRVHLGGIALSARWRFSLFSEGKRLPCLSRNQLLRSQTRVPVMRPGKVMAYHRYIHKLLVGAAFTPQATVRISVFVLSPRRAGPSSIPLIFSLPGSNSSIPDETHFAYFRQIPGLLCGYQMLYVGSKDFPP